MLTVDPNLARYIEATNGGHIELRGVGDASLARRAMDAGRAAALTVPHPEEPADPAPNFVSDATDAGGLVTFWIDLKDCEAYPGLAEAMRDAIVAAVEELVDEGTLGPPMSWDSGDDDAPGATEAMIESGVNPLRDRLVVRLRENRYLVWLPDLRGTMTAVMDRDMVLGHLTDDLHLRRTLVVDAIDQADRTGVSDPRLSVDDVLANNTAGPNGAHATLEEILTGRWCYWQDEPSPEEKARRQLRREEMARRRSSWPGGRPPG